MADNYLENQYEQYRAVNHLKSSDITPPSGI